VLGYTFQRTFAQFKDRLKALFIIHVPRNSKSTSSKIYNKFYQGALHLPTAQSHK
jgi:hypothetical protein